MHLELPSNINSNDSLNRRCRRPRRGASQVPAHLHAQRRGFPLAKRVCDDRRKQICPSALFTSAPFMFLRLKKPLNPLHRSLVRSLLSASRVFATDKGRGSSSTSGEESMKKLLLLAILLTRFAFPENAFAQTPNATLGGTVANASGAWPCAS
jgi:hypothetical protein